MFFECSKCFVCVPGKTFPGKLLKTQWSHRCRIVNMSNKDGSGTGQSGTQSAPTSGGGKPSAPSHWYTSEIQQMMWVIITFKNVFFFFHLSAGPCWHHRTVCFKTDANARRVHYIQFKIRLKKVTDTAHNTLTSQSVLSSVEFLPVAHNFFFWHAHYTRMTCFQVSPTRMNLWPWAWPLHRIRLFGVLRKQILGLLSIMMK